MNREYLLKYGIALKLLDNNVDAEFYISELSDAECWGLITKFDECRDGRNISRLDMYYLIEELELYEVEECKAHAKEMFCSQNNWWHESCRKKQLKCVKIFTRFT